MSAAVALTDWIVPVHTLIRGRSRFHVRGLKFDDQFKNYLEVRIRSQNIAFEVKASIVTGSLVVQFSPDQEWSAVQNRIQDLIHLYQTTSVDPEILAQEALNLVRPVARSAYKRSQRWDPEIAALQKEAGFSEEGWHTYSETEILARWGTSSEKGLPSSVASERLIDLGSNKLSQAQRRSGSEILAAQFNSLPVGLLIGSAALSLVTGGAIEAGVILAVVGANAFIGYKTESLAERTISLLATMGPAHIFAIRDGRAVSILADELVPGDVLLLTAGVAVPADGRLLKAEDLTVDESALTGENLPVEKRCSTLGLNISLSDRLNMIYRGTVVTGGKGIAIVVATGDRTELGKIQSLVQETQHLTTPIQMQLEALTGKLIGLSGILGVSIFGVGLLRGYSFVEMLKMSLTLAVAAVPEGLPTVATISLTQSASRMKERNVLVRTLGAVEALGAAQVICLDKTGTLTMNHMSVAQVVLGLSTHIINDGKFESNSMMESPQTDSANSEMTLSDHLQKFIKVCVLCNEAEISFNSQGEASFKGSPTEVALIEMAHQNHINIRDLRSKQPVLETEYRTEDKSYMVTEHQGDESSRFIAVKGNPEEVLSLCRYYMSSGKRRNLDPETRAKLLEENERMGREALRVLGIACTNVPVNKKSPRSGLTWLGLVGMADKPREGIKDLIASFHRSGIKTVMITGDQSATAYAVGKALGISGNEELEIFDWSDVAKVDPLELIEVSRKTHVFARVSPSEKLRIVQALQAAGNVVAMVGDGINDAPALKAADVGIAMGFKGSGVAREVADVVIMDDRLQSLLPGIALGRTTYDSIQKAVVYLVTTNMSESLLMFFATAIGWGQPLNSMQILWINLISDLFPAMALALELPDSDVLLRPPQSPDVPILKKDDIRKVVIESIVMSLTSMVPYAFAYRKYGNTQRAQTVAFTSLAVAQLLHTLSSRSDQYGAFDERIRKNKYVPIAVGAGLSLQSLTLIVPGLRTLLQVSPLGLGDLMASLGGASLNLLFNEAQVKAIQSRVKTVNKIPIHDNEIDSTNAESEEFT